MTHIDTVREYRLASQPEGRAVAMVPPQRLPVRLAQLAAGAHGLGLPSGLWALVRDPARSGSPGLLELLVADLDRRGIAVTGSPVALQDGEEYDEHDGFFGVTRTDGPPAAGFLAGSLRIHLAVARHQRERRCGDPGDQAVLETGWRCLLRHAPAGAPPPACAAPGASDDTGLASCPAPHEHWRIGHQLFFALIQGITVGLRCFLGERRAGDPGASLRALSLATDMCHHSAAAMKFAAGLDPDDYELDVRPSMLPPTVRAGFSGFQTRDHYHLVKTARRARPMLEQAGLDSPEVSGLAHALEQVYAAHHLVCARFDGAKIPSLLMEATGGELAGRSGVQVVDQLAARRLALLRQAPPPVVPGSPGRGR